MAIVARLTGLISLLTKIERKLAIAESRARAAALAKRAKRPVKSAFKSRPQNKDTAPTPPTGQAAAPRVPARRIEYTSRSKPRTSTGKVARIAAKAKVKQRSKASTAAQMRMLLTQARAMADTFVELVRSQVKEDLLKLPAKTPFTRMFEQKQGAAGTSPLFYTGELMEHLIIIRTASGYAVTWDSKNLMRHANHPFPKDSSPKSALSFVKFIETGRTRPLSKKVRRMMMIWAKKNNVTPSSSPNKYPGFTRPRPFFSTAARRFIRSNAYRSRKSFTISYNNYVLTINVKAG